MSTDAMAEGNYLDLGSCKIMLNLETGQIEPMCGGEWLNALGKKLASEIKGARSVPVVEGAFQQAVTDAAAVVADPIPPAPEGGAPSGGQGI